MNQKYKKGTYIIYLYDKYGTKQKTITVENSYTITATVAKRLISKPPYASYTLLRVLNNSLDNSNPWENTK